MSVTLLKLSQTKENTSWELCSQHQYLSINFFCLSKPDIYFKICKISSKFCPCNPITQTSKTKADPPSIRINL